jgi:hypothetical protein
MEGIEAGSTLPDKRDEKAEAGDPRTYTLEDIKQ